MTKLIKRIGAWMIVEEATDPRYPDDTVFKCIYDRLCYHQSWSLREAEQFCEAHPKEEKPCPSYSDIDLDFDF